MYVNMQARCSSFFQHVHTGDMLRSAQNKLQNTHSRTFFLFCFFVASICGIRDHKKHAGRKSCSLIHKKNPQSLARLLRYARIRALRDMLLKQNNQRSISRVEQVKALPSCQGAVAIETIKCYNRHIHILNINIGN